MNKIAIPSDYESQAFDLGFVHYRHGVNRSYVERIKYVRIKHDFLSL